MTRLWYPLRFLASRMRWSPAFRPCPFAVVLYHIDFASEDGFESRRVGRIVELLYAEHIAVVGNGNGRHAELLGPFHQRGDGGGPIEDGVLRMYMKMSELRHIDAYL